MQPTGFGLGEAHGVVKAMSGVAKGVDPPPRGEASQRWIGRQETDHGDSGNGTENADGPFGQLADESLARRRFQCGSETRFGLFQALDRNDGEDLHQWRPFRS